MVDVIEKASSYVEIEERIIFNLLVMDSEIVVGILSRNSQLSSPVELTIILERLAIQFVMLYA